MNKNVAIIILIFVVPLVAYWMLSRNKTIAAMPDIQSKGAEIIKFSSPMCYECLELENIFDEVYPQYSSKVVLKKVDVTKKDSSTLNLVKQYNVKLVPTCVFKDVNGNVIRQTEGSIQPRILENYIKEQIHG
jgi:thioredoxin-related protein